MAPALYTATATVDGEQFETTIELTDDQYRKFWSCEFEETELVIRHLQQIPALSDIALHFFVVTVYPKK
jgi:hypothetical protein